MQPIINSRKYQNGIQVFWTEGGRDLDAFFSYEEHIDMKINAADLAVHPKLYRVDAKKHVIESSV
jgi:hypothetical protein